MNPLLMLAEGFVYDKRNRCLPDDELIDRHFTARPYGITEKEGLDVLDKIYIRG